MRRKIAVLSRIESTLKVVDLVANVNASFQCIAVAIFQGREGRESGEREVDLRDRAITAIMLQLLHEVRGKMGGIGELEQSAFGIGVGDDGLGVYFFAGPKQHARSSAVIDSNL